MRKITLIGISILSVFLLCSLSYNPIIAEKEVIKIKENIDMIVEEDCGCISEDKPWIPPFLCLSLQIRMYILAMLIIKFMYYPGFLDSFLCYYWFTKFLEIEVLFMDLNCPESFIWFFIHPNNISF